MRSSHLFFLGLVSRCSFDKTIKPFFSKGCVYHCIAGIHSQTHFPLRSPLISSSDGSKAKGAGNTCGKSEEDNAQGFTFRQKPRSRQKEEVVEAKGATSRSPLNVASPLPLNQLASNNLGLRQTPLKLMQDWMNRKEFSKLVEYFESNFSPDKESFLDFCVNPCEARDAILALMRAYASLGQMRGVRNVFVFALRDLQPQKGLITSPATPWSGSQRSNSEVSIDSSATLARAVVRTGKVSQPIQWDRPSILNVNIFNAYLEVLTRRKNYDRSEVIFVLKEMKEAGVLPNPLTYHYLIEIHIRAGLDPKGLWDELVRERKLDPLPCTVQVMLLRVVPSSPDSAFVVEVTRQALRHGSAIIDKRILVEQIEVWLQGPTQRSPGESSEAKVDEKKESTTSLAASTPASTCYPPEYILWLMLELEIRCVLDKAYFTQYIQQQHIAQLLLRCAKSTDAVTAAQVLALMDRHMMTRTADLLALVVWCWAQALELRKAFDIVELMARKGYLDFTDLFKRYHVECLRYTMDRHFLMILSDAISSVNLLDEVLVHLQDRKRRGELVSVHSLNVVVLATCKLGEERRAMELVFSYEPIWGVRPQTSTLNCLLVGSSTQRGSVLLRTIYESMLKAGVLPNPLTFRILIRQAVLHDDIDEAVHYLQEVDQHPGLRVEVEMILPILERAARAGDVETVNKISKYSVDSDIGIDTAVLHTAMKNLTEAGQSIEVLKSHQPLHEALRSRSKVGRQRARSEITL